MAVRFGDDPHRQPAVTAVLFAAIRASETGVTVGIQDLAQDPERPLAS